MTLAFYLTEAGDFDLATDPTTGFLINEGAELYTAVAISEFTRRYDDDTRGPNGWWGDGVTGDPIGSRVHLLAHAKATQATLRLGQLHSEECLAWATSSGVAREVVVTAEYASSNALAITTTIYQSSDRRWSYVWEVLVNAGV